MYSLIIFLKYILFILIIFFNINFKNLGTILLNQSHLHNDSSQDQSQDASVNVGSSSNRKRALSFNNGTKNYGANGAAANEKRTATKICRVCGDKAYSYNFNVITCELVNFLFVKPPFGHI